MNESLSKLGQSIIDKPLRADFEFFAETEQNPWNDVDNPHGALALCIAENVLSWPEMEEKLRQVSQLPIPVWASQYTAVQGHESFRNALARFGENFILKSRETKLDPACFCISSGATGIVELSAFLLSNPGDVAAFPAPCYPVYKQDVGNKAQVDRYDINPEESWDKTPGVHPLCIQDLDRALADIHAQGKELRLLVLTQPDNPTGTIYTASQLEAFATWCIEHKVHLCVNELYALSQFDITHEAIADYYPIENPAFTSFLGFIEKHNSPYLHWWYSFSKDFGLSGFRTGVMYSRNEAFVAAFSNLGAPSTVSNHTQWLLTQILESQGWLSNYVRTNQQRLTLAYAITIQTLKNQGIDVRLGRGSLFVWAKLNAKGKQSDEAYWQSIFQETKVLLTAPQGFGHQDSGWLRLVYSAASLKAIQVALRRILN